MPIEVGVHTSRGDLEHVVGEIIDDNWQQLAGEIRLKPTEWATPEELDEWPSAQEIVFDIVYDSFCTPLGTRCRTLVFPSVEDFKFVCSEKPKRLFGTYTHKKAIPVSSSFFLSFQEKLMVVCRVGMSYSMLNLSFLANPPGILDI